MASRIDSCPCIPKWIPKPCILPKADYIWRQFRPFLALFILDMTCYCSKSLFDGQVWDLLLQECGFPGNPQKNRRKPGFWNCCWLKTIIPKDDPQHFLQLKPLLVALQLKPPAGRWAAGATGVWTWRGQACSNNFPTKMGHISFKPIELMNFKWEFNGIVMGINQIVPELKLHLNMSYFMLVNYIWHGTSGKNEKNRSQRSNGPSLSLSGLKLRLFFGPSHWDPTA